MDAPPPAGKTKSAKAEGQSLSQHRGKAGGLLLRRVSAIPEVSVREYQDAKKAGRSTIIGGPRMLSHRKGRNIV